MVVEKVLRTDSGDWAYTVREGAGPGLLLLHGGGLNLRAWDHVLDHLPAVPAVAVDLPLHGRTSVGSWHWPEVIEGLRDIIEITGLRLPVVAGHSVGGWTAVALAATGDAGWAVSFDGWTGPPWPRRDVPPAPPAEASVRADAAILLDELAGHSGQLQLPAHFVRVIGARSIAQQDDGRFRLRPFAEQFIAELSEITGFDTRAAVLGSPVPMTFVLAKEPGEDDEVRERNQERRDLQDWLTASVPRAGVEWLPGDHNFPLTDPVRTAEILRQCLIRVAEPQVTT